MKYVYHTIILFVNMIWNKIPSRHLRKLAYILLGAKLSKGTFPCRRVEVLLPRCRWWFVELDARGGVYVDHDTNISSHVKMII